MEIAQKPDKSGQILDQRWKIFFVILTKLIPRRIFCIAKILVLMVRGITLVKFKENCYAVADQESKPIKHSDQTSCTNTRLECV